MAKSPRYIQEIANHISIPSFPDLLATFLYQQANYHTPATQAVTAIPHQQPYHGMIHMFHSATCMYSDLTHARAVHQVIHCTPSWSRKGLPRYDCVFINSNPNLPGFKGLRVGQVQLLFSLKSLSRRREEDIPCALVKWFKAVGDGPCDLTGMWMVQPELDSRTKQRLMSVIPVNTIIRPAHLIPLYGHEHVHHELQSAYSLQAYKGYYVNKFSDYHAYCFAF